MPDNITPVGLSAQAPDPNKTLGLLSSIYGVQQQRQNLQTGLATQATAQAESQQAQQKNQELQALSKFTQGAISDPSYQLPDGSPNVQKYQQGAMAVAPTYGQQYIGQASSNFKEAVDTRRTIQSLATDQTTDLGNMLTGLATNKNATRTDLMNAIEQRRVNNPDPAYNKALDNMLFSFDKNDVAGSAAKALQSLKGMSAVTPTTVDTGTAIVPGAVSQFAGGGQGPGTFTPSGGAVPKTQIVTTPAGPLAKTTGGGPLQPLGTSGTAAPGQGLNQTNQQQTNVKDMAADDSGRYQQISSEGTNAQTGAQLADQVSQLADQVRTGNLSKTWTDRLTVLQQHDPTLTARQMLSKYAAQLKTMATQNASTDASRLQIDEGMPSPESMGPDAVKEAAQYVGGIFRMRGARQAYADSFVKNNGNSIGIRGADDGFMQAADPSIFTYKSLPAGAERQAFLQKHGLTNAAAQQEFKARMNLLNHYGVQ